MSEEIKEKIKAYYIGSDIDKVLDYIQQKETIIKEIREYPDNAKDNYIINKHQYVNFDNIREILDKGSDKE